MKKYLLFGAVAALLLIGALKSHASSVNNPATPNTIGAQSNNTAIFTVDVNRSDTYTQTGSVFTPFKTLSGAIASSTGYGGFAYYLSPGTYVDGAPDTFPSVPFFVAGNQATYVPVSGVTFPASFDVYDLNIVGNVTESDTSTASIHQFTNGVITGNLTVRGLSTLEGMTFPTTTSTITTATGSNMVATNVYFRNNFVANASMLNLDTNGIFASNTGVEILGASGSQVTMNGNTLFNYLGSGIDVHLSNATSGAPNEFSNTSIIVSATSTTGTIWCGTASCLVTDVAGLTDLSGVFHAPSGTNWATSYDENKSILNGLTVGTGTVSTNLTWIASPSSTIRVGVTSSWPGCIEMYDNAASGTLDYMYLSSTALVVTSTKPGFCM